MQVQTQTQTSGFSDSDVLVLSISSSSSSSTPFPRQTDRQTDKPDRDNKELNCSGMQWKMPMTYNLQCTQTQTSELSDTNTINILDYFEMPEQTRKNQKKTRKNSDTQTQTETN